MSNQVEKVKRNVALYFVRIGHFFSLPVPGPADCLGFFRAVLVSSAEVLDLNLSSHRF